MVRFSHNGVFLISMCKDLVKTISLSGGEQRKTISHYNVLNRLKGYCYLEYFCMHIYVLYLIIAEYLMRNSVAKVFCYQLLL